MRYHRVLGLSLILLGIITVSLRAENGPAHQNLGERYFVDPQALPAIERVGRVSSSPQKIERPTGAAPEVPEGFKAELFAHDLEHPRWLALAPNGDVFLAQSSAGTITVLRDLDADGIADKRFTFAQGLQRPHGMVFIDGAILVADLSAVWRYDYEPGDTVARSARVPVTKSGGLGKGGSHWTRNLAISQDGKRVYISIGSRGNLAEEPAPHATVQELSLATGAQRTFASGLRNPVGIAFYPGTDDLYVVVNERDGYGNNMVPDYLTRVREAEFFGWPYAYIGPNPDPDFGEKNVDLVSQAIVPDHLFKAHSAPVGLVFYDGKSFPEKYRGDAFVALRGSWNSTSPTGYKIVRAEFEEGRPTGWYENFAIGFWQSGVDRAQVWGRPAGLLIHSDGSLLVADDTGKAVWRISYVGTE